MQFINDPGSIITIFGTSAPQTAIFFLTYLLLAALPQASLNLLRLVPLIIFWVKSKFLAGTERAKVRASAADAGGAFGCPPGLPIPALCVCLVCRRPMRPAPPLPTLPATPVSAPAPRPPPLPCPHPTAPQARLGRTRPRLSPPAPTPTRSSFHPPLPPSLPPSLSLLAVSTSPQARLWQDQKLTYGTLIPNDTIAILLGMVRRGDKTWVCVCCVVV